MADQDQSRIIADNPIRDSLDAFSATFSSMCKERSISSSPDALGQLSQEELQNLAFGLLSTLQVLPIVRHLRSNSGGRNLLSDILKLTSALNSDDFDLDRIKPLLKAAVTGDADDSHIWNQVYNAVTESTPPPRPIASSIQQTPWSQNTSGFVNSSEFRLNVDPVLKLELGRLYVGLSNFCEIFFSGVPDIGAAAATIFRKCAEGDNPLFGSQGWKGWPTGAKESDVLTWFGDLIPKLEAFAGDCNLIPTRRRKLLAQPKTPLRGSTGKRSMDIGFVNSDIAYKAPSKEDGRFRWSHILVAGELKSNPEADKASIAWIDLATYAREVLAAQDTRRFVLGFTLCGSLMRVWEFDRLGGIASEQFDINKKDGGLQFVTTILGFLWMNEDGLGFDPTIITSDGERYIEIERDGQTQRLIIDEVMMRAPCIAGRATTCWKAHRKEDPQTPLVIKDSWQYTDRDEEGILVQEATEKGVVNVARYYHHETVRVRGADDDVRSNVRKGLDITKATNYRPGRPMLPSSAIASSASRKGRSSSAGVKRPSSETDAALPPSKRSCSASPTKASIDALPNRVHRRVILRDYGKPIYKASSRLALLAALEGCIEGHQSLHKAGLLHRDISINNIMINEDDNNPSWPSFLIDLDLSIKEQRDVASGARGKTGTRAFMAIGALLGEQHSFMHDLESFFWVLFWICIHYSRPDESRVVPRFEKWNYVDTEELAGMKLGVVAKEAIFMKTITDNFTLYYEPLIPLLNGMRKIVFPRDKPWEREDEKLFSRMREILRKEWQDLK
ncbi:serine/threonine-protein kinase Sgk2 [Ilyonectria robusta]|uniref:serine/threonine-protein kinase Sgk2 n=1 Tax=Ilyonectria robusta TaxID=1079257 RepID=UPI001E8E16F5|nr:serine/threonine-protein kinase Sgk2 [Ilyonectria robusta]KAH8651721.1 serine/threonine-protein kinase Sgk2 [Ilyonectria robusta]